MHEPELLILDEPIGGLDPLVQQSFHALLEEVSARGRTVFLSSHTPVLAGYAVVLCALATRFFRWDRCGPG